MTLEKLASRVAGEYVAGHTAGFSLYAGILGAIKEAVAEEREACAQVAENARLDRDDLEYCRSIIGELIRKRK